ncbi:Zn(II)2Cys6 transcription factor [Aspergillus sclerotioniger CBS 115572]|uniref:Zn(II)2Cys6 transcription factor n=1 Tax=Aspergillus sclerotioniger CBS 115572 TaxID=1450535 RepID=A0A317WLC9_9EURO|nr:Zn(II)2Cys6 transcription factor [Aspergillus sclerotioniger CBS 115572]PWY87284.1 Zn(II)2Cys6 transcription factor [Aspergillus sclerotioniger CBS 115572]
MQAEPRRLKRTANACVACRQSKIKCSGNEPCANCQRRTLPCRFVEESRKVLISERCLRDLQTQAREQHGETGKRTHDVAFGEAENFLHPEPRSPGANWPSPFTLPSMTMRNTHDNRSQWVWLAPTSTWSFTARLTLMMTQRLHPDVAYDIPYFLDGDIYPLQWKTSSDTAPDISGLPSMDYALYLFNTVKFRLGQTFRLLDEEAFTSHMQEFYYGDAAKKVADNPLWFVQFLLVLSFGKAFLEQSRKKDPPGAEYFIRAMSLMPDYSSIWGDTLLATEILALAALYLYSIDRRESGHLFASQAIRIAQLEGLHTELPEEELGSATLDRCRNLWWTLYIMDRHFSSSLGIPMIVHDSDITALIESPTQSCQRNATLSLRVKLSRPLSTILGTVYRTERRPIESFIEKTKSILNTMADLARELEEFINTKFSSPVNSMSKGMRHILLLYHQCVIFATRPLLLAVLRERLDTLGLPSECCRRIVPLMETLITTGINSATKSLQLLKALVDEGLLESFLPFDIEFTYGAAIHLTMASTLVPDLTGQRGSSQQAHLILDEIISKGNRVAEVRKTELARLETLFEGLKQRYTNANPISTASAETNDGEQTQVTDTMPGNNRQNENSQLPFLPGDLNVSDDQDELPEIGLSSYDIAAIVDQIDYSASPSFWLAQEDLE